MRAHKPRCARCTACQQVTALLAEPQIEAALADEGLRRLFRALGAFLDTHGVPWPTRVRLLPTVRRFLQDVDGGGGGPDELDARWLDAVTAQVGSHFPTTFFRAFLVEQGLVSVPNAAEVLRRTLQANVQRLPEGYRRAVEIYLNERFALRDRQVQHQAKRPLALRSLGSEWDLLARLVRWLREQAPALAGWDMVQEEHVQAFLLTLTPRHRQVVRKKLLGFFRLARRRRALAHIPLTDAPSREYPAAIEPLTAAEQRALAACIRQAGATQPAGAFLAALCFYHALTSAQICHLTRADVDVEHAVLRVAGRPPAYLSAEDLLLLEQYLRRRQTLRYAASKRYLVVTDSARLVDEPVGRHVITRTVSTCTGYSPQRLRVTCLSALCAQYGPHYLVEAFGLSLTQAGRYGNLHDFLLEERTQQEQAEFAERTRW